jgi:phosphoribosylglycinamide formyltransferase-1
MRAMKSIVILISGRGSNMQAIVRAARREEWPVRIAAVISNRADAPGLAFARLQQIPAIVIPSIGHTDRAMFDGLLQQEIDRYSPDLLVLAGFMRILTAGFVEHYAGRILNIHPSLLPSFPGLHTHRQALAAGVKVHGATVHFVTAALDHGPIVAQQGIEVRPDDTEASLAERVLEIEHELYVDAIRSFIDGRLSIENDCVRIGDKFLPTMNMKESA